MEFRTEIKLPPASRPVGHSSAIVSVGSCFAERMGDRLRRYKFRLLQNPFGIIFHPQPLIAPLEAALAGQDPFTEELFFHDGRWRSLAFHSILSHHDRRFLEDRVTAALQVTNIALRQADLLILTLGSAMGFVDKQSGRIAANCHKLPDARFERKMSRVSEVVASVEPFLAEFLGQNPKAQVLLTVSPVRHLRNGIVENSGSKAVLRAACDELCAALERVHYFPAYELQMDDLRDYRFYGKDMAHPSEVAEDYIWEKFAECWLSPQARTLNADLEQVYRDLAHQSRQPGSDADLAFLKSLRDRIDRLRSFVDLDLELREVEERMQASE